MLKTAGDKVPPASGVGGEVGFDIVAVAGEGQELAEAGLVNKGAMKQEAWYAEVAQSKLMVSRTPRGGSARGDIVTDEQRSGCDPQIGIGSPPQSPSRKYLARKQPAKQYGSLTNAFRYVTQLMTPCA